jgi:hypothetical protein
MSMHAREAIGAVHIAPIGWCEQCEELTGCVCMCAVCPVPIAQDPRHKATGGQKCERPSIAGSPHTHFPLKPSGGVLEKLDAENSRGEPC